MGCIIRCSVHEADLFSFQERVINSAAMSAHAKNPFALKVGQVMTGFGAGCGIGLGVGYPIALGSIPVLGEMMSATSSAGSRAFGGVGHHVFGMLRKLGIKNLKAGVGCGVGIGHGFGVGIALKPGVSQQIVHSVQEKLSAVASQLQKYLPSTEGDDQAETESLASQEENALRESVSESEVQDGENSVGYVPSNPSSVMKTEAAVGTSSRGTGEVEELRQENEILRTLLRHQEVIEDLKDQNASILRVLSEQFDLQVGGHDPDQNLAASQRIARSKTVHSFHSQSNNSQGKCFDCRISARRRR